VNEPLLGRQLDTWEGREGTVFAALPYGLLAITVIVSVFARGGLGAATLLDFALAAAAAAWMLWMVTLHPAWRERPRRMACYFIVLVLLMAVMVIRAPWFGFFAWTGYLQLGYAQTGYALHGRWRLVGGVAVAVVTATSQNGGLPSPTSGSLSTYLILIAVNIVIAGIMIWFAMVGKAQSDRRKQALVALTEANRKLEASLQENAGLHAQLLTQAREAGILDERQRMAREIHDTLAQGFTGIITQLEAAKQSRQHSEQWQMHVDHAQRLARESLVEARRSVQALRPEPLEESRLP
jgi:signal transduction histidine kinase